MTIAILAHDSRKELALQFCTAYSAILSKNVVIATGTTTSSMIKISTSSKKECNAKKELYVVTPIASAIKKLLLSFGR